MHERININYLFKRFFTYLSTIILLQIDFVMNIKYSYLNTNMIQKISFYFKCVGIDFLFN